MKVKFDGTVDQMRGMAGGREKTTMGFSMGGVRSQQLNRRVRKTKSLSEPEKQGQLAMSKIMWYFSNLSQTQRIAWDTLKERVRREWKTKAEKGPEQTHPKEITYTTLDFYVSVNHHRVLGGLDPRTDPLTILERPEVTIEKAVKSGAASETIYVTWSRSGGPTHDNLVWVQLSPPWRSAQRHARESDLFPAFVPLQNSYQTLEGSSGVLLIPAHRYSLTQVGYRTIRFLLSNGGDIPYGYTSWHGVIPNVSP
jgi:hypothetical protein